MPSEIVLLMSAGEAEHLGGLLRQIKPTLDLVHVSSRSTLEDACLTTPAPPGGRRLVAFCTSVIVPGAVLDALGGDAYNFHPAPPTYPGRYPSSFALYDGVREYGATVHMMEKTVDTGAIVAVETFAVPPDAKVMDLEVQAYKALLRLFEDLAPHLANMDGPLPTVPANWSGPRRTKKDYDALMDMPEGLSDEEIARRERARRIT